MTRARRNRRARLVPFVGLTLLAGIAIAGPTSSTIPKAAPKAVASGPTVTNSCSATEQNCLKPGWLETPCGKKNGSTCKPILEQKLKQRYDASSAPLIKMLRPNRTDIPADVKQGKYNAFTGTSAKKQSILWPSGSFTQVPVSLTANIAAAAAETAHRKPEWDANGQAIASCSEYAYEKIYDLLRFLDAAEACRGDSRCVFEVAYMNSTPGVADRTLLRKDGKPMDKQIKQHVGKYPKNVLFSMGAGLLYANGVEGGTPISRIPALEAALAGGSSYYNVTSEWQWHKARRDETAHLSEAEREEYRRRRSQFQALIAQYGAAVSAEAEIFNQKQVKQFELPFDHVMLNPFDRFHHISQVQNVRINESKRVLKQFGPAVKNKPALETMKAKSGIQGMTEPHQRRGGASALGVLASPSVGPKPQPRAPLQPTSKPQPNVTAKPKAKVKPGPSAVGQAGASGASSLGHAGHQISQCHRSEGWGPEMFGHGPISCKIGEFLRAEWTRKQRGQKSCLDLGNPDCDWEPRMLEESLLQAIPQLDDFYLHEQECKTWTSGAFTPPLPDLTAVEALIKKNKEEIGAALQHLRPYTQPNTPAGKAFGKSWAKTETHGSKKWFAAQFKYDTGWRVAAQRRLDAPGNAQDQQLCELSGGVHGTAEFSAWVVNKEVKVVDGQLHAKINDGGSHKAELKAKLRVLGKTVGSDTWVSNTVTEELSGFGTRLPNPRPSFTFMAGPVPVTGALWGELMHGVTMTASGSATTSCNVNDLRFRAKGSVAPFFGAYGMGQIGVGISGVVSAGIRVAVNLIMLQLPLELSMDVAKTANSEDLVFNSEINLLLSTLAGRLSVYLEFLFVEEEWEIFSWRGLGPAKVPLMPKLSTKLPTVGMK